jgi:hypothetical protein
MRLPAFCAALWLVCATALTVPNILEKFEDKVPTTPKYFREPGEHQHYDLKYFVEALEPAAQNARIKVLMQTYLATLRDLGVQTWLMHGSLLGWWWGKKVKH